MAQKRSVPVEAEARQTILIAGDDEAILDIFARMLRMGGYRIHTLMIGKSWLVQAECLHPTAVILDFRGDIIVQSRQFRSASAFSLVPAAVITGDYFISRPAVEEVRSLGIEIRFKPVWLEDMLKLAGNLTGTVSKQAKGQT